MTISEVWKVRAVIPVRELDLGQVHRERPGDAGHVPRGLAGRGEQSRRAGRRLMPRPAA